MKKYLFALTVLLLATTAQAEVGVSVSIGQPGFYGQIDIGDYYPRPRVIYAEPRVIHVLPYDVRPAPLYMRVPPGHAKRWSYYCDRYNACARPVYFVQDSWYNEVYVPRYREYYDRGDDGRRYDRDYWDRHGHGNWHPGKGNGRGRGNH
jgi:hypothetical protein